MDILHGFMIGVIFGMPLGAIGAISMQRTITFGYKAGLLSGCASSIVDVIYACIGVFGFHYISNFLLRNQSAIHVTGACILILMAIGIIAHPQTQKTVTEMQTKDYVNVFMSSFVIAITNPAAILSFLYAFSLFNIQEDMHMLQGFQLITGIFLGTFCWWLLLVTCVHFMKRNITLQWFHKLNKACAILLFIVSISIILNTI